MISVKINNLEKKYHKKTIIRIKDLKLDSSNIYFLTQSNGSGKTTFLKCLFNEISYSGDIFLNGNSVSFCPEKVRFPESYKTIDFIKSFEKINYTCVLDDKIEYLFNRFDIMEYLNIELDKLSKGTLQKVKLIVSLLTESDIYLFDEPLSGLDNKSRSIFIEEIASLKNKDKLIIIASHYYEEYPYEFKKGISII